MRGASTASGFGGGASEQVSGAGVGVQRALSARGEVERGAGEAEEMAVEVQSGDVVVAATDGLLDNLFPEDMEAVAGRCLSEGLEPQMVVRETTSFWAFEKG
ncbi:hypothetical protein SASPL_151931 [Salvia splendens]|uniref:Uncharacterized protein n=1 Tax=Salvia splendens TaxID=180675 RepID=A0A8X8YZI9_SALSN|nr:hypothetical protein SASPL_151931 [Salvia splendens]